MLYSGSYPVRYTKPSIVGMLSILGYVDFVRWGKREEYTGFWWGNLRERDHLGDPSIEGRIILNRSSGSGIGGYGLDRAGSV